MINMKNRYYFDYTNENEFRKLERGLKKTNIIAFKKLIFDIYSNLREGNFKGDLLEANKEIEVEKYSLMLPTDRMFAKVHGEVKLFYTVYKKDKKVVLETITPADILLEAHISELTTCKGIMLFKPKPKDIAKIDLYNVDLYKDIYIEKKE